MMGYLHSRRSRRSSSLGAAVVGAGRCAMHAWGRQAAPGKGTLFSKSTLPQRESVNIVLAKSTQSPHAHATKMGAGREVERPPLPPAPKTHSTFTEGQHAWASHAGPDIEQPEVVGHLERLNEVLPVLPAGQVGWALVGGCLWSWVWGGQVVMLGLGWGPGLRELPADGHSHCSPGRDSATGCCCCWGARLLGLPKSASWQRCRAARLATAWGRHPPGTLPAWLRLPAATATRAHYFILSALHQRDHHHHCHHHHCHHHHLHHTVFPTSVTTLPVLRQQSHQPQHSRPHLPRMPMTPAEEGMSPSPGLIRIIGLPCASAAATCTGRRGAGVWGGGLFCC